jgi:hypothetical protein
MTGNKEKEVEKKKEVMVRKLARKMIKIISFF